jgi:hypothetical protein
MNIQEYKKKEEKLRLELAELNEDETKIRTMIRNKHRDLMDLKHEFGNEHSPHKAGDRIIVHTKSSSLYQVETEVEIEKVFPRPLRDGSIEYSYRCFKVKANGETSQHKFRKGHTVWDSEILRNLTR